VMKVHLSSLTSDQTETLTHGGPAMKPDEVTFRVTKAPTALCAVAPYWLQASDSTTTSAVKFVAEAGGDIAGYEVDVLFTFYACKDGGIG
jgi:hypothetical protein